MGKFDSYSQINYNGNNYAVCGLHYNGTKVPIIMDYDIFTKIKKLDKNWHVNDKGIVIANHKIIQNGGEVSKEIYLHDIILKLSDNDKSEPILHINKIGVDNRKCNLMYDNCDKHVTKNIKKKERTIQLPQDSGINSSELPSFVWYLKEDSSHGDRFVVDIGDTKWKSTSSKKVSLRYKLEETKKYLRHLKEVRKDLFENYSMNGDLNNEGKNLTNSFIKIAQKAGFKNLKNEIDDNTDNYLAEKIMGLTSEEKTLLEMFNPEQGKIDFR